ncbi:MAG: YdiU family protein [Pseudoxanthomonas suwonensis]|nr:YdiU family protein [Pseudoxanthomonas suwonensis]
MKPDLPLTAGLRRLQFDNAFVRDLPGDAESGPRLRQVHGALWSAVDPDPVRAPVLLAHSPEMAAELALDATDVHGEAFKQVLAGNALLPGMQPFASNYGGHQFGHWAGQLGDGRAISLGEVQAASGKRWELQLKGAGSTPYSRGADGRAVLRSSIREFLCSEAMHHLGVPTTRALSLIGTGEQVVRDMFYDGHPRPEPGAIVCRAAPGFIRFGHFELPAARGEYRLLQQLADFCIRRDFPHLSGSGKALHGAWFREVALRTAEMVAHWMRVGFVHGVMNTDNMSILGLTIDYGPYGWLDDYDPDFTPNTTDLPGRRYRYQWQPRVAHWNLGRLAQALAPLFEGDAAPLQAGLDAYATHYRTCEQRDIAAKLGLSSLRAGDRELMAQLQDWMQAASVDMTLLFRALGSLPASELSPSVFSEVFHDAARRDAEAPHLDAWLARYRARVADDDFDEADRQACMRAANPVVIPRNWLVQKVIDRAEAGDPDGIGTLLQALRRPYDDPPAHPELVTRRPDWARDAPGCSMLSCSS